MLGNVDLQFVTLEDSIHILPQKFGQLATIARWLAWQKSQDLKCNVPEEWNLV